MSCKTSVSFVRALILFGVVSLLLPGPLYAQKNPIYLGMSAAFTGPTRALGIDLYRGAQSYFTWFNDQGGLNGRPIIIKPLDDGYNPDPCVANTLKFAQDDSILALFSYVGTPTTTRILPILQRFEDKHLYLLFPFTGAAPLRKPPYEKYVINLRASYAEELAHLVNKFVAVDRKRIAVFYQIDAYGRSGWDGTRKALASYDLDIVGEATYKRGAKFEDSMAAQVKILKKANPDAIISIGAYQACSAFIRDARDLGLDVPIANVSFVSTNQQVNLLQKLSIQTGKDYTRNLINSQVLPHYLDPTLPAAREYMRIMESTSITYPDFAHTDGLDLDELTYTSFEGFLNAKLTVILLSQMQNNISRANIPAAVESLVNKDLGIGTPLSFGKDHHHGLHAVFTSTFSQGSILPLTDWSRWLP